MKINLQSPVEEIQIQIIPLIDVVFCVLTFFILAALQFTRQQAISVDLPKASTGLPPQVRQTLIVTIDAVGQVYVEKQPVRIEQLRQVLQNYHQSNPAGIMILNASRTSTYNDVVQVLDLLRAVGGDRVALATVPASESQSTGDRSHPNVPGVPGALPAPGAVPANPYSTSNPYNPYTPNQSLPVLPGQVPDGQDLNPAGPSPVTPLSPVPQTPATPGKPNAPSQR